MSVAPSPTLNNASCVAIPPQVMQNLVFPVLSINDLSCENTFSIYCFPLLKIEFDVNSDIEFISITSAMNVVLLFISYINFYGI
jgi:hypothetical protein